MQVTHITDPVTTAQYSREDAVRQIEVAEMEFWAEVDERVSRRRGESRRVSGDPDFRLEEGVELLTA